MFDIHKVKPVHGWREFLGEVGIIVLGVLIALGFEQVVEIAHWRDKVAQTKETLRESVGVQALAAIEQQVVAPCIEQQLDALEHRLLAAGPYRPATLYKDTSFLSYVVRAPSRPWGDSVWSAVIGEGVSTHYDPDFRDLMDRFYGTMGQNREIARQIDQLSGRLNALALPIPRDPSTIVQFARDIEDFRAKEQYMTLVSGQMLFFVEKAGMVPPVDLVRSAVYRNSGTIAFCRAHGLTLDHARATRTQLVRHDK